MARKSENSNPDNIYRVWSGLDAFVITIGEEKVYLPSIDIIASDPVTARKQVALLLGQKIEDQETNPAYENFVCEPEYLRKF